MGDRDLYVMINLYWQPLAFTVQVHGKWARVIDTSAASGDDIVHSGDAVPIPGTSCAVNARSIVVLIK